MNVDQITLLSLFVFERHLSRNGFEFFVNGAGTVLLFLASEMMYLQCIEEKNILQVPPKERPSPEIIFLYHKSLMLRSNVKKEFMVMSRNILLA